MIQFARRNYRQAVTAFQAAMENKKELSKKEKRELSMLQTIGTLLEQQTQIHKQTPRNGKKKGISIPNRIVSIFRNHIRPIPRGKIPVPTEFGAKVLLELRGGIMQVLKITYDNIADCEMLSPFMDRYSGLDLGGDRGFHSPKNRKLSEHGVALLYCRRRNHAPIISEEKALFRSKNCLRSEIRLVVPQEEVLRENPSGFTSESLP
jgi:hypothetical protein